MRLLTFSVALLSSTSLLFAQPEKELEKANEMYKNFSYVDAIKIYERIAQKGFVNQEMLESLGNAYYYNAEYKKALPWYEQLFQEGKYKVKPEYYYRYAQTLKSVGDYTQADKMMAKFVELTNANDTRAALFEENKDYQTVIKNNSGRFQLNNASVNTENSEYGTAFYGDKIVFAGATDARKAKRGVSQWTGESFYDLYEAEHFDQKLGSRKPFSSSINTQFNESTPVFTKDRNTMYFTRNNYVNRKLGSDIENTILLKILRATKDKNGNWGNIVEVPFNSDQYNVAHPALSPDEKYLYFASDMPGSFGNIINTAGRESFPYISKDNVLYYSSDGIPGLGGLDIFAAKFNADGSTSKPVNIGMPGNSADDDFCFVFNSDSKIGFLTSNRPGGKGKDDIYSFHEDKPLLFSCQKNIKGIVKDAKTKAIIANAKVILSDKVMKEVGKDQSKTDGTFTFEKVNCNDSHYYLRGEKEKYETAEVNVTVGKDEVVYEILLNPREVAIKKGMDLAKVFEIKEIKFDYNKADIRPDAAVELTKIVEVMREYPKMKIDIRSHTDSRGADSYNLKLSDRRAKATLEWIVKQGIDRKRLKAKGYGETRLVNGCSNGVPCTEEEHQENRRSEFIVVAM